LVSCQFCGYFQPYDKLGSYGRQNGGHCGQYQHYKEKGYTEAELNKLLRNELGGCSGYPVFIGSSVRDCKKFKGL
jgi:hypothetical protein